MKKRYRIPDWYFGLLLVWFAFVIIILSSCNLAHKTSKNTAHKSNELTQTDSIGKITDTGGVSKETGSKTSKATNEKVMEWFAKDPVTNNIYPTAIYRETGTKDENEQYSRSDSNWMRLMELVLTKDSKKDVDQNSSATNNFTHGVINVWQFIGIAAVLLSVTNLILLLKKRK